MWLFTHYRESEMVPSFLFKMSSVIKIKCCFTWNYSHAPHAARCQAEKGRECLQLTKSEPSNFPRAKSSIKSLVKSNSRVQGSSPQVLRAPTPWLSLCRGSRQSGNQEVEFFSLCRYWRVTHLYLL